MNDSPLPPMRGAAATVAAAFALFLLYCGELRWSGTAGAWAPPATLVIGLALSASLAPIGGAALAVWAGLLHAAATAGPPGLSVAAAATLAAFLRGVSDDA
ncbi:hypothetical protein, partial [Alienimonas chondri]|uniref:hypothetical protein n=1 Tax=Alienimonas chondri TaxID=2681879 RepID=UPI001489F7E5